MEYSQRKLLENHDVLRLIVLHLKIHDWFSLEQVRSEFYIAVRGVWNEQKSVDLKHLIREYFLFRHICGSGAVARDTNAFKPELQRKKERICQIKAMEWLKIVCPKLEKLKLIGSFLRGSCEIMHPELLPALAAFTNLKALCISGFSVNVESLQFFLQEAGLQLVEFDLRHNFLESRDSADVESLPRSCLRFFRNVKSLTVDYNTRILALRPPHGNLREIRLFRCCSLTVPQMVDFFSDITAMEILEIHNFDFIKAVELFSHVPGIGNALKILTLSAAADVITTSHFVALTSWTESLVELRLEHGVKVWDDSLALLAQSSSNLETISFNTTTLSEAGFKSLSAFPSLKRLILPVQDSGLGREALVCIANIPQLECLDISSRNAFFVFDAMRYHATLAKLKIDVYGKQVIPTDASITTSPNMRTLKICFGKWVSDQFVVEVVRSCGGVLRTLWIHGAVDLSTASFDQLGKSCRNLNVLGIALDEVNKEKIAAAPLQEIIDKNSDLEEIYLGRKVAEILGDTIKIPCHILMQEAHSWQEYRDVW